MLNILHRIGTQGSTPDDVYAALATIDGLAAWWTTDTSGDASVGGTIAFRFGPGGIDAKVLESRPGELVRWEFVDGPAEWIGTTARFDIRQDGDFTIVLFAHEGWREPVEFLSHCSTKWATFLLSLKRLVETGTGTPAPDDLKVSDYH